MAHGRQIKTGIGKVGGAYSLTVSQTKMPNIRRKDISKARKAMCHRE
jgi:hypothetical protein